MRADMMQAFALFANILQSSEIAFTSPLLSGRASGFFGVLVLALIAALFLRRR